MRSHTRTSKTRRNDGKKKKSLALLLFLIGGVFVIHYVIDQVRDATFDQTALVSKQFTRQANQAIQQAMADTQQVPLIVQTDQRWGNNPYGYGEEQNTFAANGCAIASLAMIDAFWTDHPPNPDKLLKWAGDQFYLPKQGTSWQIFPQFAEAFGYQFADLGDSFEVAYEKMTQGIPVVVSVQAGTFTTSGHIMVLALNKEGNIQVFDPNDSPEKAHYEKSYPNDVFQAEGIHYWSFWL